MRSDKELLELLKDGLLKNSSTGMCGTLNNIFYLDIINSEEFCRLRDLIKRMKPKQRPQQCYLTWWECGYYFNPYDIRSRVKSINNLIKTLRYAKFYRVATIVKRIFIEK